MSQKNAKIITGEDVINDLLNRFATPRISQLSVLQTDKEIFRLVGQAEVLDYLERAYVFTREDSK